MIKKALKRPTMQRKQGQKGSAMVLALIVLCFGGLVVGGLLQYVDTSVRAAGKSEQRMYSRYAADAGVEYLLSELRESKMHEGDIGSGLSIWPVGKTVNGKTPVVTINRTGNAGDWTYTVVSAADNRTVTAAITWNNIGGSETVTVTEWEVQ